MGNYIDHQYMGFMMAILTLTFPNDEKLFVSHIEARKDLLRDIRGIIQTIKKETGLSVVYWDGRPIIKPITKEPGLHTVYREGGSIKPNNNHIVKAIADIVDFVETSEDIDFNKCLKSHTSINWGDIDEVDHLDLLESLAGTIRIFLAYEMLK